MKRKELFEGSVRTSRVNSMLEKCDDPMDFKTDILPLIKTRSEMWQKKIAGMVEESGMTGARFAALCGISRAAMGKWLKGALPRSRDLLIKAGLVAGYDKKGIDRLLQRYGNYPELYSKNLEDCICLYVIGNYTEDRKEHYDQILQRVRERIGCRQGGDGKELSTRAFDSELAAVKDDDALESFIEENADVFAYAYHRLNVYIKGQILANIGEKESINLLANGQGWSSSLKHAVYDIYKCKWIPNRNKLISIGLHLNMDLEQMNNMLVSAHMEPLYAKNSFEGAIIYILKDAEMNFVTDEKDDNYDPEGLIVFAREKIAELDIPELNEFIGELEKYEDERSEDEDNERM